MLIFTGAAPSTIASIVNEAPVGNTKSVCAFSCNTPPRLPAGVETHVNASITGWSEETLSSVTTTEEVAVWPEGVCFMTTWKVRETVAGSVVPSVGTVTWSCEVVWPTMFAAVIVFPAICVQR